MATQETHPSSAPLALDLDEPMAALLQDYGFEEDVFSKLRGRLNGSQSEAKGWTNALEGTIAPPLPTDVQLLPARGSAERDALHEQGLNAIREGKVGAVILAGGMATRFGGVVKADVEVLEGLNFLDLKLLDIRRAAERAESSIPVFLMTSFATQARISEMAAAANKAESPVEAFPQFISLRVNEDGSLFRNDEGALSPYAPGHGDLPFALQRSGLLDSFRAQGGELLYMSNVDNLGATLDPAVIGAHLQAGTKITAEVVAKQPGDKGGAPARVDGDLQIVEAFRFPSEFDQDEIGVFNTNSFVLDAESLAKGFPLSFFTVKKKVEGRVAIQFERLVGELTAFLPTSFLQVDRNGSDGRFQPVKDPGELDRRRQEIRTLLAARGAL